MLLLALLFLNGSRTVELDAVACRVDQEGVELKSAGQRAADFYTEQSYTWFINPAERSETAAGRTVPVWLTGMRRTLSSSGFTALDAFLNYHRAESAARSFASWRTFLCGSSGSGAISVLRPGDCYVYALCRIVV